MKVRTSIQRNLRWLIAGTLSASAVFAAHEGDVVGPVKTDMGFHLIKVEALRRADSTADTAATNVQDLIGAWLQSRTTRMEVQLYECI